MTEPSLWVPTEGPVARLFRALSGTPMPWLVAATLVSLVIVVGFLTVMAPLQAAIKDRADYGLIDLELPGHFGGPPFGAMRHVLGAKGLPAEAVLSALKSVLLKDGRTALGGMKALQWLDVGFTLFYGAFLLLLAGLIWRCHPGHPGAGRWVWLIALGAPAALLDELENFCILRMIELAIRGASVFAPWPILAMVFSVPKWGLLFVAMMTLCAVPLSLLAKAVPFIMRRAG